MITPQYELRYGLRVPMPAPPGRALDLRPRRVQEWIQQLPLAEPQESGRQLLALLRGANGAALDPGARQRLAETVHDTTGPITRALMKSVSHRGFPLTGRALQQADLCTALQRAMADAYKLVVAQALDGGRHQRKLLAQAVQQAIMQLSRLLLDQYALYAPAPDGLWLDLHRLHRIAEQHDLLAPASSSRRAPAGSRIGELYRQCLLISLANPYRLQRDELGRLTTLASALAHRVIISSQPTAASGFQVSTEQDRPPFPRNQQRDTGGIRFLDLSAVVEALEQAGANEQDPELPMRRRLLALWRQRPRRGFKRLHQAGEIRVGVGLETAHHLLERDFPAVPEIPPPRAPALGVVPPLASMIAERDEAAHFHPIHADEQHEVSAYPLPGTSMPAPQYREHEWRTLDVSARGCCLRWNSDRPSPAKVGDVIMLQENESSLWTVGVVRWMQYDREQGLKMGVEILAPGAFPVMARNAERDRTDARQDRALQLPAVQAAGLPASLILGAAPHRVGELLEVIQHGKPQRIRLVGELERNGSFAQFAYETVSAAGPADKTRPHS